MVSWYLECRIHKNQKWRKLMNMTAKFWWWTGDYELSFLAKTLSSFLPSRSVENENDSLFCYTTRGFPITLVNPPFKESTDYGLINHTTCICNASHTECSHVKCICTSDILNVIWPPLVSTCDGVFLFITLWTYLNSDFYCFYKRGPAWCLPVLGQRAPEGDTGSCVTLF